MSTDYEPVPTLAPDAHHTVDWDRVRATIRRVRPVRLAVVAGLGLLPAVVWCNRVALPLAAGPGVDTAFAAGVVGLALGAIGLAGGGRIRRWISAALFVAALGGTLLAAPTRNLISIWIVGA